MKNKLNRVVWVVMLLCLGFLVGFVTWVWSDAQEPPEQQSVRQYSWDEITFDDGIDHTIDVSEDWADVTITSKIETIHLEFGDSCGPITINIERDGELLGTVTIGGEEL